MDVLRIGKVPCQFAVSTPRNILNERVQESGQKLIILREV